MRRFPAALLLALTACSDITVTHDYDPGADFSSLRTYAWYAAPAAAAGVDTLTTQRIIRSMDAELAARGFRKLESGTPDFLVHALAAIHQRLEAVPTTTTVGYGWRGGTLAYGTGTEIRSYDEGTLILDVISPGTKQLVWRGTAKAAVSDGRSPEEREARIREGVAMILENFPPNK
jgi:hypothetical protein